MEWRVVDEFRFSMRRGGRDRDEGKVLAVYGPLADQFPVAAAN